MNSVRNADAQQSSKSGQKDLNVRHALLLGASSVLTKLADLFSSSKIVLVWSFASVGAPAGLLALFAPTRESLSMLPQVFLGGYIKQRQFRKELWIGGSIGQGLCVVGMIVVLMNAEGMAAGLLGYLMLIAFSLSRALCSLTMKDILGKTVVKDWRGRVTGNATSISAFIAMLFAAALYFVGQRASLSYLLFLAIAVMGWFIASIVFAFIKEPASEVETSDGVAKHSITTAIELLREDSSFRRFIAARGLLICSAIVPVFIVIEMQRQNTDLQQLAMLLLVSSLGSTISSHIWGRWADHSARVTMLAGAIITALNCILLTLISLLFSSSDWLLLLALFFTTIAHSGIRVGRKTYVVNIAKGNSRTDYVAVSNTLIGCLLLITGGLVSVFAVFSAEFVFPLLAVMAAAGAFTCWQLKEVAD